jgi:hypothetical protein
MFSRKSKERLMNPPSKRIGAISFIVILLNFHRSDKSSSHQPNPAGKHERFGLSDLHITALSHAVS